MKDGHDESIPVPSPQVGVDAPGEDELDESSSKHERAAREIEKSCRDNEGELQLQDVIDILLRIFPPSIAALCSRLAEPTLDPSSRPWCATCTTKGDKVTCDAFACNLPPGAQRPTEYAGPLTEPTQAAPSEDAIASMAAEAIADHGYLANRDDIRRVEHVIQQYIAPLLRSEPREES